MMIRGVLIVSQWIWVLTLDALLPMLLLLMLSLVVLSAQGLSAQYIWQSFKLLLWFFIPAILMQGLFTPGMMVQYPIALPLSMEGLMRGLDLSLHIAVMFFTALVVFRLFAKEEWIYFFHRFPLFARLLPYLFLLATLKKDVHYILDVQKAEWQQSQNKWKKIPDLLVDGIQAVLQASKQAASALWQGWDNVFMQSVVQPESVAGKKFGLYLSCLVIGWLVFVL